MFDPEIYLSEYEIRNLASGTSSIQCGRLVILRVFIISLLKLKLLGSFLTFLLFQSFGMVSRYLYSLKTFEKIISKMLV